MDRWVPARYGVSIYQETQQSANWEFSTSPSNGLVASCTDRVTRYLNYASLTGTLDL